MDEFTQVLVIGGGPAGSTAATLLAREGFKVTLFERDFFPREHIGESLLASVLPIFDLLGVREKVEAHGFVRKYGGYFEWRNDAWEVKWGDPATNTGRYGFQVVRSELDHLLLKHAGSQGVAVREGVEVTGLSFNAERPIIASWSEKKSGRKGSIRFDYLIDASGRAGVLTTKYLRSRRFNETFQNIATWGYWKNFTLPDKGPSGAIFVAGTQDGWFWAIPLHNGTLSVGLVQHKSAYARKRATGATMEELYHRDISNCALISDMLGGAELVTELKSEQDFSYIADTCSGPGYFISGDAACFLDPLLSTGFHLATYSAVLAAASVSSLAREEVTWDEARACYDVAYRQAYLRYLVLVATLYENWLGKDDLFREAHELSRIEVKPKEFIRAFSNIISGIEDLQDCGNGEVAFVFDEVQRIIHSHFPKGGNGSRKPLSREEQMHYEAEARTINAAHSFANSPESATHGLFVTTKPRLGLVRVGAAEYDPAFKF